MKPTIKVNRSVLRSYVLEQMCGNARVLVCSPRQYPALITAINESMSKHEEVLREQGVEVIDDERDVQNALIPDATPKTTTQETP